MKSAICVYLLVNLVVLAAGHELDTAFAFKVKENVDFGKLDTWTPGVCAREFSSEVKKRLPFFLAGYDVEGRPVVIAEIGRWRLRELTENNETTRDMVYRYAEQFWCKVHNLTSPMPNAEDGVLLIYDMATFPVAEVSSLEVMRLHLYFSALAEKHEASVTDLWMINTNAISAVWFELTRPVTGKLHGRFENKGAHKEKFLPVLSGRMDGKYIPPWLGGTEKDWKPLEWN